MKVIADKELVLRLYREYLALQRCVYHLKETFSLLTVKINQKTRLVASLPYKFCFCHTFCFRVMPQLNTVKYNEDSEVNSVWSTLHTSHYHVRTITKLLWTRVQSYKSFLLFIGGCWAMFVGVTELIELSAPLDWEVCRMTCSISCQYRRREWSVSGTSFEGALGGPSVYRFGRTQCKWHLEVTNSNQKNVGCCFDAVNIVITEMVFVAARAGERIRCFYFVVAAQSTCIFARGHKYSDGTSIILTFSVCISLRAVSLMCLSSEGTESSGGLPSFTNFFGWPMVGGVPMVDCKFCNFLPHDTPIPWQSLCACTLLFFSALLWQ